MNEIVSRFLLARKKLMPEMCLGQPGYTYSASVPFTKNEERIEKFKERGDVRYINQNELDKACFEHDISYWDFKDSACNKAFNIVKNPNDVYQRGLASMVHTFFDKKLLEAVLKMRICQTSN